MKLEIARLRRTVICEQLPEKGSGSTDEDGLGRIDGHYERSG
jgi:hypothetical protein